MMDVSHYLVFMMLIIYNKESQFCDTHQFMGIGNGLAPVLLC